MWPKSKAILPEGYPEVFLKNEKTGITSGDIYRGGFILCFADSVGAAIPNGLRE